MSCRISDRPILVPALLGRDGALRAFTLVAADRPGLTLADWLAEIADSLPPRDRPLAAAGTLPPRGLVGLVAPTGCLFAVFAYAVEPGSRILAVRGPSWSAPLGGRMVPDALDAALRRLAADLGCGETSQAEW